MDLQTKINTFSYRHNPNKSMFLSFASLTYYLLGTLLLTLLLFYKYRFGYWKRLGLYNSTPTFPFGNITQILLRKHCFAEQFDLIYKQFKRKNVKHGGVFMFASPVYVPINLDIIKNILRKDFDHFVNRGFYIDEKNDPLSTNIFYLEGTKWRNLRTKLNAAFTPNQIKMMFETMVTTAKSLKQVVDKNHSVGPISIKELLADFTVDIISSCAFGIDSNALSETSQFKEFARGISVNSFFECVQSIGIMFLPKNILQMFKIKNISDKDEDFIFNMVKKTVEYREKNNVYRKDFLHLLLQLKHRGKLSDDEKLFNQSEDVGEHTINDDELAAHVFFFFVAAFDTSSTAMSFAVYEVAKQASIQDKLRNEIVETIAEYGGQLTYEAIQQMEYLNQVISETLRMYPSVPILNRICNQDYRIPDSNLILRKGIAVVVPVMAIQNDPEYFPHPDVFDPERFSKENRKLIHPMAYMPFGDGPRHCIGMKFGLVQSKVALVSLLRNYTVTVNARTVEPVKLDPSCLTLATDSGIYLDFKPIV